jgi:hypothetical protein
VRHVEVSKKMEVPKNHAKLMVINAKTQWFVVPIFLGTPLKWRDPIIRLGEVRWGLDLAFKMWRSKANVQLMFTISHSKSHSFLETAFNFVWVSGCFWKYIP